MLKSSKYVSIGISASDLRERNRALALILDIGNLICTTQDLEGIARGALEKVCDYFDLEAGRIYLGDEEGQAFTLLAHRGIDTKGLETIALNQGFTGRAVQTRSFMARHVSELDDLQRAGLLASQGFKIVICVPLIFMEAVLGVMNLTAKKTIALDQNAIDLLIAIGAQIAVAVNNARLFEEVEKRVREIEEKKETIKRFAYSVSHDIKGPAIGIQGLTKRLYSDYRDGLNERGRAYCEQILKASSQLMEFVAALNTYIASREAPLHRERFDLREIIDGIKEEFREACEQKKIELTVTPVSSAIVADRLSITRTLRNLVDNALKYGGDRLSEVHIGCRQEKESVTLFVRDNGVGIRKDRRSGLFEAFARAENSRGIEGSGLGLAIVKEIAERHGGKAWVESHENDGATFYFSIPHSQRMQAP